MESITIIGPPGTGKTYYIEQMIKGMNNSNYLYLTYNVSMAQHARGMIEDDRHKIGTIHSIMAQKNGFTPPYIKLQDMLEFAKRYGLTYAKSLDEWAGQSELERFLRYYDRTENLMEKPRQPANESLNMPYLFDEYKKWKEMQNKKDYTDILIEASKNKYYADVVFVDESQDLSPLMWQIIDNIECEKRYIVGDPHQSINEFRGVRIQDFIKRIEKKTILEKSYRFGDNIRMLGDTILGKAKMMDIKYRGIGNTEIDRHDINSFTRLPGSKAILCRTNSLAYMLANKLPYAMVPINPEHAYGNGWTKTTFKVAGIMKKWPHVEPEEFRYIVEHSPADLWVRGTKAKVKKEMTLFSYDLMKKKMDPLEIIGKLNIDQKTKDNARRLMVDDTPMIYIDTIHAAKGLEWDHVIIANDFPQRLEVTDEERRLFYVAVTRAKKTLDFIRTGYYQSAFPLPVYPKTLNITEIL